MHVDQKKGYCLFKCSRAKSYRVLGIFPRVVKDLLRSESELARKKLT